MRIELKGVSLERAGGVMAVEGVSCAFDGAEGRATALLGANGAGKSSLLEGIVGLVPIRAGSIEVDGVRVEKRQLTRIRSKVGMVFQNADDQLFSHSVGEDVAFGPRNLGLDEAEVRRRVEESLSWMGVSELAEREVSQLSGGEKRRVALAGVLAMRPEAILLDEPTSMLDPRACRELAEHLRGLSALQVIATHDLAFARRVCDRAVLLQRGRLVAEGALEDVLARHELLEACGLV